MPLFRSTTVDIKNMESEESTATRIQSSEVHIIGLLGGPGSGKGTQSKRLSQEYEINHISVGDILRAEADREGSEYAPIIKQNMLAGTVGPREITIKILKSHILKAATRVFILDGKSLTPNV